MQRRNGQPKRGGKGSRMRRNQRRAGAVPNGKGRQAQQGRNGRRTDGPSPQDVQKAKAILRADKHVRSAQQGKGRSSPGLCHYFNTPKGCRNGDACSYLHVKKGWCKYGKSCRNKTCHFQHPAQMTAQVPVQMTAQMQYAYAQGCMPVYYAQQPAQMQYPVPQPAQMDKQAIGEKIFPRVQEREPKLAGKITGMLLEMDNTELSILIEDEVALENKIKEALAVLRAHSQ